MYLQDIRVPKNCSIKECEKLIIRYSRQYVYHFFADKRKNRDKLKKLEYLKTYINNNKNIYNNLLYNNTINIKSIIYNIINNLYINHNILYIGYSQKLKRTGSTDANSKLFKLITYGNLELPRNDIIEKAISHGIQRMLVRKRYGR